MVEMKSQSIDCGHYQILFVVIRGKSVRSWCDPSWSTHLAISSSSHRCMTGVTKAVVCLILSVG